MEDEAFKGRHRERQNDFTRVRSLPFALIWVRVMRKSVKSLQNVVNEAMTWLNEPSVTARAYSRARYKLKHTAFIELNQKAVVKTLYSDHDYQGFWGFRVLAVDGSKRLLPDSDDVREAFGTIAWTSGKAGPQQGEYPCMLNIDRIKK